MKQNSTLLWTNLFFLLLFLSLLPSLHCPHLKESFGMYYNWKQTFVGAEPPLAPDWPICFLYKQLSSKSWKKGHNMSHMGGVGGCQTRIQLLLTIPRSWLIWNIFVIVPEKTGKKNFIAASHELILICIITQPHATPIQIHYTNNN